MTAQLGAGNTSHGNLEPCGKLEDTVAPNRGSRYKLQMSDLKKPTSDAVDKPAAD